MSLFTRRILVLLFVLTSIRSYCGTIKGTLTDKKSGEPVTGATVALKGTTYGAVTGLDGSYELRNVPAGSYDFVASFVSMETYTQHITLAETQTLVINCSLATSSNSLAEVEIKAKIKKGSEEEARNVEKNSDNLLNAVSARYIEILPDITIANVLQRVSGVTVQRNANGDARYAIIRGMDKRYNYTTVNGVKIPSPDDKMRYVPMDIFPAELVERLEVIKSLTPDMEGDAVGGVMNLQMKSAPDHLVAYASVATGYNQTLFDREYQGFPKSGFNLKDPIELHGSGYSATPSDFQLRTGDIRNTHAPANGLMSFTVGDRFLKSKKLGVVLSGSYQNTFKGSDGIFFLPSIQPGVNNAPAITDLEIRKYSTQETRSGIHTKVDYEFNKKNSISLYGLFLQLDELQMRQIIDTTVQINRVGPGTGPVDITQRAAFRRQSIGNLTLQGKHLIADNFKVDYSLVYSLAKMDVPDMTELHTTTNALVDSGSIVVKGPYFKSYKHSWERTKDEDRSAYLNFTYTPDLFGKNVEFKAGGMYRNKDRSNYYNDYSLSSATANQPFSSIYGAQTTISQPLGDVNNPLAYTVNEQIASGYAQAKTDFNQLQVLAGVRVENTHDLYHMNVDPDYYAGQTGEFKYTDVLPSVHFKYALDDKQNIRLSYFESISRPGFFEIVPYQFAGEYYTEVGNDSLNHSVAQNLDLRYEWFPKGIDELLVGAFYKSITNPIEYGLIPKPGGVSAGYLQPMNVSDKPATNYGAEIVIAKYFHSFGVSANYTYTHSAITTTKLSRQLDSAGSITNYQVSVTRPLQGQSAHIANLALIYKDPKLGLDAHLSWVYTGRRIAFLSEFVGLDYWQRATSFFDFSCEKRIVKHISIYAKVNNLLNTPVYIELMKSKEPFLTGTYSLPYQTLPSNTLVQKDSYGRNYLIGIRYKLN